MKTVIWLASSKKDLENLPKQVMRAFGYAIYQAQQGSHPDIAKVMKGFGGAEVLELVDDDQGSTFRAVYTVRFADINSYCMSFRKRAKEVLKPLSRIWISYMLD
jgi:phage-related protein